MALIPCRECDHEVSDAAAACPNCGAPVATSVEENVLQVFTPSLVGTDAKRAIGLGLLGLVTCGLGWYWLFTWYMELRFTKLEVTNKRITLTRGIMGRDSTEVLLGHIRNVTVHQRAIQRVVNAGDVGISSSGQADVELVIEGVANPHALQALIDANRPPR